MNIYVRYIVIYREKKIIISKHLIEMYEYVPGTERIILIRTNILHQR